MFDQHLFEAYIYLVNRCHCYLLLKYQYLIAFVDPALFSKNWKKTSDPYYPYYVSEATYFIGYSTRKDCSSVRLTMHSWSLYSSCFLTLDSCHLVASIVFATYQTNHLANIDCYLIWIFHMPMDFNWHLNKELGSLSGNRHHIRQNYCFGERISLDRNVWPRMKAAYHLVYHTQAFTAQFFHDEASNQIELCHDHLSTSIRVHRNQEHRGV